MVAAISVRMNGKAEMAYVGEKPWHGLGQKLTAGMPLEMWIHEAGIDWKVQRAKVRYPTSAEGAEKLAFATWDDRHVLFRSDTKAPLSLVSKDYNIVQPRQILEFFREFAEKNHLVLETAGTLFNGRQYWAMARTTNEIILPGNDRVRSFVLLATSCDGSIKTIAKFTSERVVCANTLEVALHDGMKSIKISHASKFDETQVKLDLGLIDKQWAEFEETLQELSTTSVTRERAIAALVQGFGAPEKYEQDLAKAKGDTVLALQDQPNVSGMAKIMKLFDGTGRGSEMKSAKGTEWGLINAVTEYLDHDYGKDSSNRLSSAWWGPNAVKKSRVMAYLTA